MYNWDYNLKTADKKSEDYKRWKLERMINYGLNKKKINLKDLKKHWKQLKIDPDKKRFLKIFLS